MDTNALLVFVLFELVHIGVTNGDFCQSIENYEVCSSIKQHFDCSRIHEDYPLAPDGVYSIHPVDGGHPFQVYCDMTNDGGGWLVIQRHSGTINFNRTWMEYREGFGNIRKDFWLGNDRINRLTEQGNYELRIKMVDSHNRTGLAKYSSFHMGDMNSFYKLNIDGYVGNTGDSLSSHNGMRFSTSDYDVDQDQSRACGAIYSSGWWFNSCRDSNLNGDRNSTLWTTWTTEPLVMTVMEIRPGGFNSKGGVSWDVIFRTNEAHNQSVNRTWPQMFDWVHEDPPSQGELSKITIEGEDCQDILDRRPGAVSGVYTVGLSDGGDKSKVYCDMVTDGGGWVVFQKRFNGSEDFFRTWDEYKNGFGHLTGEFWLGNDNIHRLTAHKTNELRVDLTDRKNKLAYAKYNTFSIADSSDLYRLTVSGYSGTAGDSLKRHNGMPFSTKDKDSSLNHGQCATKFHGAWWYQSCHDSNLNGHYNDQEYGKGLDWHSWHGSSMKETTMKIRPRK